MATSSPSQALAKRSLDTSLMPPPPPPKRIKRPAKVLDEDDYTDALSHIIARDFFPGLLETEAKQEYLDALESQNHEWVAAAGRKLTEVMTPGRDGRRMRGRRGTSMIPTPNLAGRGDETPKAWQGDTPMSVVSNTSTTTSKTASKSDIDTNMSLSAFQQKYTSEDNESFYALLDKQNRKKAEKHAWLYSGNKIPAPRQIAHRKRQSLLSATRSAETAEINGKELVTISSSDTRQAMPDTWTSKPDNSFMFPPQSIEDSTETVAQRNEESSLAPPKRVAYDNTRIGPLSPSTSTPDPSSIPPSPSLSAVRDAIAGHPRPTASEAHFSGASTPRVNGYAFVDEDEPPPPANNNNPSSPADLLLTSGTAADATLNPFKLRESSKREALHHRMVDRVARNNRSHVLLKGKRDADGAVATPRFLSSPVVVSSGSGRTVRGGLTPAGVRLVGKLGGKEGGGGGLWEGRGKVGTPGVGGEKGLRGVVGRSGG